MPIPIILSVLQRWKEQYFVNVGTDCGLTIAGFYYVCFSCSDGSINGFYYDPNSRFFYFLELITLAKYLVYAFVFWFLQNKVIDKYSLECNSQPVSEAGVEIHK